MMKTKLAVLSEKIIEAGWLVAVVAVPLFFNIYSARTFEPDKITLLRSIAALMILAWIVLVVEEGRVGSGENKESWSVRLRNWVKRPLVLPTLLLVIIYIASTIFSISPNVSLWGSYQRLQGTYSALSYIVIFALMAGHLRTREQVDRLVATIIIASIPVSLYGIIQRYGLDPLPWAGDVTRRVASNMGNAIFVASYLIMVIPLTLVRLVESMSAIIKEEKASWGYTILAAVYIFALAVQAIAVFFTQSRGPLLGILGAVFLMGIMLFLLLRRLHQDPSRLGAKDIGSGILFVIPLGLSSLLVGAIGYFLGKGLENLLAGSSEQFGNLSILGAAIGAGLGLFGLYIFMAAAQKGWRWLWLSWLGLAVVAIVFVLTLSVRGTALDPYLNPIRQLPNVNRISNLMGGNSSTVRVLIWESVLDLISPHEPLGVEADEVSGKDNFNMLRPLVGYGPESMFNAFAYVYPPGLAHVEARGSSADRSHNETMDSLVITGVLGFVAFYFLVGTVFYYCMIWLGWAPNKSARSRLIALLLLGGVAGGGIPYLTFGNFTFAAVGLPFGMVTGLLIHLIWQGIARQQTDLSQAESEGDAPRGVSTYTVLLIGALGAIIGHFIEVHFVFSIAATYTYFWVYLGLMVGLSKLLAAEFAAPQTETETVAEPVSAEQPAQESVSTSRRSRKSRSRRGNHRRSSSTATPGPAYSKRENWDTWVGAQGLAMAIIMMILSFDFITPQFTFDSNDSLSLLWILIITWLVGVAITLSTVAIRKADWPRDISWGRAVALYSVTSLFYFFFYTIVHRGQFGQRVTVTSLDDIIKAANVLAYGLVIFYISLLVLMVIIAVTLSWRYIKGLPFWRSENWWLYPPLIIAVLAIIWFKNIDVVRADVYLKEGERYRNNRQWDQARSLHEKAISLDSDEDFYYLMLALDYQLMAQDGNLDAAIRQNAWQMGEQIALQARDINPYNPDNTGNMGRYYFTLGQVFDPANFDNALEFFEKATVLAPSNVTYHNLWAQTHYILQNYDAAIDRLQTSISIDGKYPPTWILLGDAYAAKGDIDNALDAHTQGMLQRTKDGDGWAIFADQFLNQRLNFYISAGRGDDLIAAIEQVAENRGDGPDSAKMQWAIGRIYNLQGQPEKATEHFELALTYGDNSVGTLKELANIHLNASQFEQALPLYQQIIENQPNDVEAHSALAFIYAQQNQLDDAIFHNLQVLEQSPEDYDSLKNLAILYQQKQQWQEALDVAQRAQVSAPEPDKPSWDQFIANIQNQLSSEG